METVAARLDDDLATRLKRATDRKHNPYAPSKSQLVVRGLELALAEVEKQRGARK